MDYEIVHRHRGETFTEGDAIRRAIISAMNGLGSLVLREDGAVVWEMEVDTKDDSDPHRPVIVHFRGHSLEAANGSGIAGRELF